MGTLRQILFLVLISTALGCAKSLPVNLRSGGGLPPTLTPGDKSGEPPLFFETSFTLTDLTQFEIGPHLGKPLVLLFSQQTCTSCIAETIELSNYFKTLGHLTDRVHLLTILVGAVIEDAQDFKDHPRLGIQWPVGIEKNDDLFKKVCPGYLVPCVVVVTPENGFVFQKTGEFELSELEAHTGRWE